MGCNYKNWAVAIKNAPNMKLVYKILFMDFENLKFSLLRGQCFVGFLRNTNLYLI